MANQYQSIDPTLVAINAAKKVTPQAKKTPVPSLTTQAPMQSSLNAPKQQPQAISTNITPPTAKIGGISSPFGAPNINSSPVMGGATPQEIGARAKELQSLPKAIPQTGTSNKIDVNIIGSLGANVMAGEDLPTIRSKYPEFSGIDDEVLGSVLATMYDGVGPEEILQKFPELQGDQKGFLEGVINKAGNYIESSNNPLINNKLTRGYMSGLGTVAGITEKAGEGFVQGAKTLGAGMIGLANKADKALGILPEDSQNADILASKLGLGKVSDKSLSQDILNVGEGTFATAGNVLAPAVSFAFGIGAQTPGLNKALEQVSYGFTKIGEIINKVPGLSNYRDSLPPEDQKRFDSLVGNSLLAFIGSKKGKLKEGDIRGYLDDNFGTIGAYDKAVASNIKENTSGIRKLPAITDDLLQGSKETYARKVVGLTENTIQAIKSNKYLSEAEGGKLTRDSITQSAGNLLNKQIQDLSETGRGYSQIRESGIPIDVSLKKPAINKILSDNTITVDGKGILDFTDSAIESKADQAQLQKVYDYFKRGEVTPDIYLNKKKAIRDMTDFSQGNADQTNRILKQIGAERKQAGHNSIPELKQLDAIYEPQITDINEIRNKIFDKDGKLREGATSYIMNSLGANRDVTLQKLEKLIPEISEQVKAIRAVEDINASKGIRPGTYNKTAAIIGGAKAGAEAGKAVGSYLGSAGEFIGGGIGGIVGAIGGIIATDPAYIINKLRGVDVKLPDEIVQKIKDKQALSIAQKNKVKEIVSSLDQKKQQVIIEQVKKDQKYPIKLKQEGPQTLGATLPKALPKTPPITVEKGAIGMGTPKPKVTPVIPPKATVTPSVSAPKVDNSNMPLIEKQKILTDYLDKHNKARESYIKSVYEQYDGDIAKSYIKDWDNKFGPKAVQARKALGTSKGRASTDEVSAKRFMEGLSEGKPVAPKTKIDDTLLQEAKKYKTADEFMNGKAYTDYGFLLKEGDSIKYRTTNGVFTAKIESIKNTLHTDNSYVNSDSQNIIADFGNGTKKNISSTDHIAEINGKPHEGSYKRKIFADFKQIREQANKKPLPPLPKKGK